MPCEQTMAACRLANSLPRLRFCDRSVDQTTRVPWACRQTLQHRWCRLGKHAHLLQARKLGPLLCQALLSCLPGGLLV